VRIRGKNPLNEVVTDGTGVCVEVLCINWDGSGRVKHWSCSHKGHCALIQLILGGSTRQQKCSCDPASSSTTRYSRHRRNQPRERLEVDDWKVWLACLPTVRRLH